LPVRPISRGNERATRKSLEVWMWSGIYAVLNIPLYGILPINWLLSLRFVVASGLADTSFTARLRRNR
jgi:hypothetical protein